MNTNLKVGDVVIRVDWAYSYKVTKQGLAEHGCYGGSPCENEKWIIVAFHQNLPATDSCLGKPQYNDVIIINDSGTVVFTKHEFLQKVVTKKTFVKKASEIVKWLEDNNYKVTKQGSWMNKGQISFTKDMFYFCGKETCVYALNYHWLPEWLEEKEI